MGVHVTLDTHALVTVSKTTKVSLRDFTTGDVTRARGALSRQLLPRPSPSLPLKAHLRSGKREPNEHGTIGTASGLMIRWPIDEVLAEQAHVRTRQMSSVPPPPEWEGSGRKICLLCLETVSVAERHAAHGNAYHEIKSFRCSECDCTLTATNWCISAETDELKRRINVSHTAASAQGTESETSTSLSTSSAEAELKFESAERDATARHAAQSLLAGFTELAGARGLTPGEAPRVLATDCVPCPFRAKCRNEYRGRLRGRPR